jgi:hypothetical protein
MTKLRQHIEEMRARVAESAATEQSLVKSLDDALNRIDQQLLKDVRTIAAEHEARRVSIFNDLQALACNIGMFQPAPEVTSLPTQNGASSVGDWRQATRNLSYQDEIEAHLNERTVHLGDERNQR